MTAPFFICGAQRSGTTMLCSMFNRHPILFVANEMPWLAYDYISERFPFGQEQRDEMVANLARHHEIDGAPKILKDCENSDPFHVLEKALRHKASAVGKSRWGIKDPHLLYHLDKFLGHFSGSQAVVIYRDCRAVVSSNLKTRFHVANAYYGAQVWAKEIQMHRDIVSKYGNRVLTVQYEQFVQYPEANAGRICDFLNVNFVEEMMEAKRAPGFRCRPRNVLVLKKVTAERTKKWGEELTSRQIAIIESVAGNMLTELGYPVGKEPRSIPALERLLYRLHQTCVFNYWWQKRTRFSGIRRRLARLVGLSRSNATAHPSTVR